MSLLKKISRFTKAAHICSNQCFNANQEHQIPYCKAAFNEFDESWKALPTWLKRLLTFKL